VNRLDWIYRGAVIALLVWIALLLIETEDVLDTISFQLTEIEVRLNR
jgi:hypothetical protein